MKIDLRDGLSQEMRALTNTFRYTPHNSDSEKTVFFVGLALGAIILLASVFGLVDYNAMPAPARTIVDLFTYALAVGFGINYGAERVRMRVYPPESDAPESPESDAPMAPRPPDEP